MSISQRDYELLPTERIADYIQAAVVASGMSKKRFESMVTKNRHPSHVRAYEDGRKRPTTATLLRIEELSGLSLDAMDPRIRRGMDYASRLRAYMASENMSQKDVQLCLRIGSVAVLQILRTGEFPGTLAPDKAIALCEMMEGRWTPDQAAEDKAKEPPRLPRKRKPAESMSQEHMDYLLAVDIFRRNVSESAKAFRFREVSRRVYEGVGEELLWRLVLDGNRARLTAIFRKNGVPAGEWVFAA